MRHGLQSGDRSETPHAGRFLDYASAARHERVDTPLASPGLTLSRPAAMRDFFGRPKGASKLVEAEGPEGFLVELPEKSRSGAHFHDCPEFQLFFPSEGAWYQRHPFGGLVLHYVDAYTTYGPFGTNEVPLEFYTLRPQHSTITGYMPWAREQLIRKGRRNTHVPVPTGRRSTLHAGEIEIEQVLPRDADGLEAKLVVAGPETDITLASGDERCGGQYVCVVRGGVEQAGVFVGERALAWMPPGAAALTVRSCGEQGCALLVMVFPASAADPEEP